MPYKDIHWPMFTGALHDCPSASNASLIYWSGRRQRLDRHN